MSMTRLLALLVLATIPALGAEPELALKPAPGHELVETNCQICHSLDYIPMNSPFLAQKGWDAEVHKMIKAYGAPLDDTDAQAIIDYLAKNYGG
jgi:sulfite dehydrogenase (cytochrome) subunit B